MDPRFPPLYERCAPYTMTSLARMYALWQAVQHIDRVRVAGDVVECGVYRGGSAMLAALTLAQLQDRARLVWLFDTFAGMTPPGARDVDHNGRNAADLMRTDPTVLAEASLEEVQANTERAAIPASRLRFIVGDVAETVPAQAPDRIALLRLDTDWHDSTRHELVHLWPRLEPGGILIVDDYGHWQGARQAVDQFFAGRDDAPVLWRIDPTGRFAFKPSSAPPSGT